MTPAKDPTPHIAVDVVHVAGAWERIDGAEALVATAIAALCERPPDRLTRSGSVCVALSDDEHVRLLNRDYRGQDKPTNVLSFESSAGAGGTGLGSDTVDLPLGDVVLAVDTLVREAESLAIPVAHHLQHLCVHGVLHLLGYDHETDRDASIMEAIETATLAKLGIPDPYSHFEDF